MRYKLTGALGWVVAGVVLLAGAGDRSEVRARRLVIEDEKGREVMTLSETNGRPHICLYGESNSPRVLLGVSENVGPYITIRGDRKAFINLGVSTNAKGLPIMTTRDEAGNHKRIATEPF